MYIIYRSLYCKLIFNSLLKLGIKNAGTIFYQDSSRCFCCDYTYHLACIADFALSLVDFQSQSVIGYHDLACQISFGKLKEVSLPRPITLHIPVTYAFLCIITGWVSIQVCNLATWICTRNFILLDKVVCFVLWGTHCCGWKRKWAFP